MKWNILRIILIGIFMATLMACEQQGPAERAGEKIDEAAENAGKQIDEAVEEAGDKLEEAGDKIKEQTQN
ncbi:MAG: hypothetical protein KDI63_13695 [Gammaproteobacteria bacterium]|nr:hypothetical protein [Gammaproteobacteria bacterium]